MVISIGCVVEGHGDPQALTALLTRLIKQVDVSLTPRLPDPVRNSKSTLVREGKLERAVQFAALEAGENGGVLVVVDADDGCVKDTGPALKARAEAVLGGIPVGVVLAVREFESWFLAAAESLRGTNGLAADLTAPADPEAIRGAKEWLSKRMTTGHAYRPTRHQAALARRFDIDVASQRSPSFDRLCREVRKLIAALSGASDTPALR